ncbi:Brp/Blh family beta-carotene 15,15'-dioxygenase [Curtobacterium sp. L1-20]|uniref:Brp/Blh family beta-carotene 15,15'-dioxygenase n=1 Tax=Curtobacterium sp. L1-20 TaxID=3138181 RepID=UPI003B522171
MTALVRGVRTPGTATEVPPALRIRVADHVLAPVTVVLALVAVVCAAVTAAGGSVPVPVQLVPFAVSVLVFGLPHGALDHLVPARLRPGTSTLRSVTVVVVLYLVVGSATALLWVVDPVVGFAAFIAVTWFHWGQGDVFVDRLLDDGASGRVGSAVTLVTRGALPMLVPFAAHPAAATAVVSSTASVVRPGAATAGPEGVPVPVRVVIGLVVLGLVVLHLVAVRRSGAPVWRQAAEDAVLLVFFAVVPPVLAVGLYFTLWHSVRHILRLELTDPTAAAHLHHGRLRAPFGRFVRQAWPITAIAVAMLVVLAVVLRRADLGTYLVLIATLTTPHAVVVTWMDHVQHTWRRRAPGAVLQETGS